MIQNTANKQLSELFSADNKISYYIPKYQREYIWTKWNWEALFDDILENNEGHFLGSIICINTEKDSSNPAKLELVDGQQRMTTISLLYLSIYKYLLENLPKAKEGDKEEDDESYFNEKLAVRTLRNRIILDSKKKPRLAPSLSSGNLEDYNWIFSSEISALNSLSKPKRTRLRRLHKSFQYFNDRFNAKTDEQKSVYDYHKVKQFLEKLNAATLVKIDVATHADAFTLFETLNNRGVPLSAIDLIKNKLLGQLEKVDTKTSLDENFERWNRILSNLTDEYTVQERFLRQFYNAFKIEKEIEVDRAPKALRSNLIRIYETLIEQDVFFIFNRLEEASAIYADHIGYDKEEHSIELSRALQDLVNVTGADGYMLLLFIEKRF